MFSETHELFRIVNLHFIFNINYLYFKAIRAKIFFLFFYYMLSKVCIHSKMHISGKCTDMTVYNQRLDIVKFNDILFVLCTSPFCVHCSALAVGLTMLNPRQRNNGTRWFCSRQNSS